LLLPLLPLLLLLLLLLLLSALPQWCCLLLPDSSCRSTADYPPTTAPYAHRLVADIRVIFNDTHALQRHQPAVGVAVHHFAAHGLDALAGWWRRLCLQLCPAIAIGLSHSGAGWIFSCERQHGRLQLAVDALHLIRQLRQAATQQRAPVGGGVTAMALGQTG
jgi:hypothetical protein